MKYFIMIMIAVCMTADGDTLYTSDGKAQEITLMSLTTTFQNKSLLIIEKQEVNKHKLTVYNSKHKLVRTFSIDYDGKKVILDKGFSNPLYRDIYKTLIFSERNELLKAKFRKSASSPELKQQIKRQLNRNNLSYKILFSTFNEIQAFSDLSPKVQNISAYSRLIMPKIAHGGQCIFLNDIKIIDKTENEIQVQLNNEVFNTVLLYNYSIINGVIVIQKGYLIKGDSKTLFYEKPKQ